MIQNIILGRGVNLSGKFYIIQILFRVLCDCDDIFLAMNTYAYLMFNLGEIPEWAVKPNITECFNSL